MMQAQGQLTITLPIQTIGYLLEIAAQRQYAEAAHHIAALQQQFNDAQQKAEVAAHADAVLSAKREAIAVGSFEHGGTTFKIEPAAVTEV
jgi:hypothetical protein